MAKIIDFGIARTASGNSPSDDIPRVRCGPAVGTPSCMSPEQAVGGDLDVRADIYSLGVILYELLTNEPPFEPTPVHESSWHEVVTMIRERKTEPPSVRISGHNAEIASTSMKRKHYRTVARQVAGDLDWIVMKAMEKDRSLRYHTALDLARDIESYLDKRPVSAAPSSVFYRVKKFIDRHTPGLVAYGLALCLLILGMNIAAYGLARARVVHRETTKKIETRVVNDLSSARLKRRLFPAPSSSPPETRGVARYAGSRALYPTAVSGSQTLYGISIPAVREVRGYGLSCRFSLFPAPTWLGHMPFPRGQRHQQYRTDRIVERAGDVEILERGRPLRQLR